MSQDWTALLLADPSPVLRFLVLRDLFGRENDDSEVRELAALSIEDPLRSSLLSSQMDNGAWPAKGHSGSKGSLRATTQALIRLGTLGLAADHDALRRGAEFLFSRQIDDGSWPLARDEDQRERYTSYDMIPLQTALPLRGLATAGFANDPRAEKAYEWLLDTRLEDGAWPTGLSAGTFGRVAGYRRLPRSRWGCRSNTTGVLLCLAYHPQRRSSTEAQRALDHLLVRETRDRRDLGFEVARVLGMESTGGLFTYYARFDMALLLELCWRIEASLEDDRVASLVEHVKSIQGPNGLWEYVTKPHLSRWLTFELLRSLSRVGMGDGWVSLEPRVVTN